MRYGGVSDGLFTSLNGKKGSGDLAKNVNENRLRILAALCHPELEPSSVCSKDSCQRRNDNLAHIIHEFKTNILDTDEAGEFQGFDASITSQADLVLSQTTADCGTIIISDDAGLVVALVHGSWHTISAGVIAKVIKKLRNKTQRELIAGIGPMICKNCYEFGSEATTLFARKYIEKVSDKYHVDLKQLIIDQLRSEGVSQVNDVDICTLEDERFFSHRRDGAASGRFITLATRSLP